MWNVYEDRIIHNDDEFEAVCIVMGLIHYDYASPKAKELYSMLTPNEVAEIERKLKECERRLNK